MDEQGLLSMEKLLGIPTMPLLPPAPSAFGLLGAAKEECAGEHGSPSHGIAVDSPTAPAAGEQAPSSPSPHKHPILHVASTALCILMLALGIAMMSYPSISDQVRLDEIYDEVAPVEYVLYGVHEVPVIEYYEADRAPDGPVAGIWLDATIIPHANYTYVIGHNPGIFSFVLGMEPEDEVSVAGAIPALGSFGSGRYAPGDVRRGYVVSEVLDVARGTYVTEVERLLADEEDVLVLQACVDESEELYRVVICLPEGQAR